jgi:Asp-tRNA(Asn)/Glu-tRNA(Gln) amidotransferase A subunit family amidase
MPPQSLSGRKIVGSLSRGDVTCEAVARACLERVAARDGAVKAWAHLNPPLVISHARALDRMSVRGPLHGVPIGVKDVIDTHDMPTGMGSPIYRDHRPTMDASCLAMLRMAGALVFGKTVTCEFAGATPAQTTNPHDVARTPGGSSSGSAAAVAEFMVPLALGTQTGGSILRPASYCGVVGYKPTYGLISCAGVKIAAESLDTVGFLSRGVEDLELADTESINC